MTKDEENEVMELYHTYRLEGLSPKDAMEKAKATLKCFIRK